MRTTFRCGWDIGANGWVCDAKPFQVWDSFPRLVLDAFGIAVDKSHQYRVVMVNGAPRTIEDLESGFLWRVKSEVKQ